MPDEDLSNAKPGVHGWRAGLWMLGCGTAAALLVVGLIVGGLRMVLPGGGDGGGQGAAVPSRSPRASTEPGVLDVCGIAIESSGMLSSPVRQDEDAPPLDTATASPSADPRVVTDECAWRIVGADGGNQTLTFEYEAVMSDSATADKDEIASQDFVAAQREAEADFSTIIDDSLVQGITIDDAYTLFGEPNGEPDIWRYTLVGRVKSSVFTISVEGPQEEEVSERVQTRFFGPVRDVLPYIESDLERIVPD
jgi:hypothetical protein